MKGSQPFWRRLIAFVYQCDIFCGFNKKKLFRKIKPYQTVSSQESACRYASQHRKHALGHYRILTTIAIYLASRLQWLPRPLGRAQTPCLVNHGSNDQVKLEIKKSKCSDNIINDSFQTVNKGDQLHSNIQIV